MIRYFGQCLMIGFIYFTLGRLGLTLATLNSHIAPVWPACAVSIGALYCRGVHLWPAVWFATLAITLSIKSSLFVSMVMATGNTLEAVSAVYLLRFFLKRDYFSYQTEAVSYALTSILSPIISATFGVVVLLIQKQIPGDLFLMSWVTWWAGNALGALIGVPLMVSFCSFFSFNSVRDFVFKTVGGFLFRKTRIKELIVLFLGAAVAYTIFWNGNNDRFLPLLYFVLLFAGFFASADFQLYLTVLISVIGIWGTSHGRGPFHAGSPNQNIVFLQLFLSTLAITALSIRGFKKISQLKIAAITLTIGWFFNWAIFLSFQQYELDRDDAHFKAIITDVQSNIKDRVETYEMALRSGTGLMSSMTYPTPKKWKIFYDKLELLRSGSGLSGIGVISKVLKKDLSQFVLEQKKNGEPNYTVKPVPGFEKNFETNRDHYLIRYLESTSFNRGAIGLDIGSEPLRRQAADRASSQGSTVVSPKIDYYYSGRQQSGFLMLVAYPGGWVFTPLIVEDFFNGILGRYSKEVGFSVFESEEKDNDVFYSTLERNKYLNETSFIQTQLDLGQRKYHIHWYRTEGFTSSVDSATAWVMGAGGFLVVLLASLIVGLKSLTTQANLIAERKTQKLREIEKNLLRQTQFLQTILDYLPVALFCKDVKAGYRFSLWNRMSEVLFGLSREAIVDKTDYDFFPKEQSDYFRKKDEDTMKGRKVVDIAEEMITTPNHGDKFLHTIKVPIYDREGEPELLLGISLDITDLKNSQKILEEQRAKLIHSSKMSTLGEMAGGIAHEINNPLAIISASTFQLKRAIETLTIESERAVYSKALDKIDRTVERISKIVRGLRSFSRNSDRDPFENANLNIIVGDTLEFCAEKFKFHNVELIVLIPDNISLKCRSAQISQVLLNFLMNSFDAVIGTAKPWVKVEATVQKDDVLITITDSGTGIPKELHDKIFVPFFSTKEVGKGTGLGLSISKGIIEDHGGALELDTESPNTSFVIRLPLNHS